MSQLNQYFDSTTGKMTNLLKLIGMIGIFIVLSVSALKPAPNRYVAVQREYTDQFNKKKTDIYILDTQTGTLERKP